MPPKKKKKTGKKLRVRISCRLVFFIPSIIAITIDFCRRTEVTEKN